MSDKVKTSINVLHIKTRRPNGRWEYTLESIMAGSSEHREYIARYSRPGELTLKTRCGDWRVEDNLHLIMKVMGSPQGPAEVFPGGSGVLTGMIAQLSDITEAEKELFLRDIETQIKSYWIHVDQYKKLFNFTRHVSVEHSDCHGWRRVKLMGDEEYLHIQSAIAHSFTLRSRCGVEDNAAVYVVLDGEEISEIHVYYIEFDC